VRLALAALQGAVFGILATRLAGSESLRFALYGAIALPLLSMVLSARWPRLAAALGLLLVGLWTATCGAMAYEDPSLQAWEWIPGFAFLGLLFGAGANSFLFRSAEELGGESGADEWRHQARSASRGSVGSSGGRHPGAPSPPPPRPDPEPDPWSILGIAPGAAPDEVQRAFRARMAEYHPDKVATMGPEIRALADEKAKAITLAYARARRAAS
jgi:hypothetical protein